MAGKEQLVLRWRKFQAGRRVIPRQRQMGAQTVDVVGRYLFVLGSYPLGEHKAISTFVYDRGINEWKELTLPYAPHQRFGHVTALVDDKLILFGGSVYLDLQNDLHVLDLSLMKWTEWRMEVKPPPLVTSTAHYVEKLRRVLVVCGKLSGRFFSKYVYALDPDCQKWLRCRAKGRSPQCGFHASCLSANKIYIIGGVSRQGPLSGTQVYMFDFSQGLTCCIWSKIEVVGEPARSSIGSSLVYCRQGKILHLGGKRFSVGPTRDKDFLHLYDLEKQTVSLVPYDEEAAVSCTGSGPTERRNFGFAHWHDKLIVFGGYEEKVDHLYALDVSPLL